MAGWARGALLAERHGTRRPENGPRSVPSLERNPAEPGARIISRMTVSWTVRLVEANAGAWNECSAWRDVRFLARPWETNLVVASACKRRSRPYSVTANSVPCSVTT